MNYKQLAVDLLNIQVEAVSRNKELLERAEKGAKQCFEKDIRQNPSREDRDLYGQAARDAELGRMVRSMVKACPKDTNLLTDNLYKAYAFDLIAKEAGK